jgi:hypothetical protein
MLSQRGLELHKRRLKADTTGEMILRRARGFLLRLVRRRALALTVGIVMIVPAAWVEIGGRYDAWWIEGLALVAGATGIAIFWTGLTGGSPDWVDDRADS